MRPRLPPRAGEGNPPQHARQQRAPWPRLCARAEKHGDTARRAAHRPPHSLVCQVLLAAHSVAVGVFPPTVRVLAAGVASLVRVVVNMLLHDRAEVRRDIDIALTAAVSNLMQRPGAAAA